MADQAEETPKETPGSPTPAAPEAEVQQQDDEHGEGPVPKPEGEEKPDDGRGQDPTPKPEGDVKTEEPSGEQQEVVEAPAEQKEEEKTVDETTEQQPAEESPQGGQTEGVGGEEGVTEGEGQKEVEETQAEQKEEDAKPEESTEQPKEETVQVPAPSPIQADQGTETDKTQEPEPDVDPSALSPRSKVNLEATATVKFVLMPSGQVVTQACTLGQTLEQLKQHFSMELKLPVTLIMIMFDGKTMPDSTTLADLGVGPNGTIQLELQSADPVNTPIKAYRPRQEYHMPDVITVRVQAEDNTFKDVVVEIERTTRKKPFLGGYRHKKSSVEYHHASAQTMQKPRPPPPFERFCRDTQTVEQKHRPQQTTNEMSTQMTGIGVFVSNREDKLLRPKQYTTADEYHLMILNRVIIIQKYYRRWLARRYVQKLKEDKLRRLEFERLEEIRKKKEKADRIKKEFERRMNPKNKEDFDLLYHALEKWRQEELERINTTLTAAERKAALCMLLDQETQLIAAIGRHKIEADSENKDKRIQDFLDKAAAPKKWKGFDGKGTEMDTPFTIRAKELRDIYNSINMKYLTQDERLDVLLTLKHTVKEHDCKLTQEIIELIDREADLLMRGVKETNLDGLRKRISTLFLQYLKTPTFNPEAAKLLKVPQDPTVLRKNIYFCPSCNSYLPSTEFAISSNSRNVGKCRRCTKIDNDARVRQDYSHYRYLLKQLRKAEQNYLDNSKIAFLLQEHDLRYLVDKVWGGQSILSAWDDLFDLTMVRWNKHEEWSPWNCILLTKDEAAAHDKLVNLEEGYGQVFIQKVQQKHVLARNYFSRMPGMAELVKERASERDTRSGPSIQGQSVTVQ
ncbi:IQ and ubiquitin-like domain-containing protein [Mya arenaria]|uniref:IQ and ubiquitin-like domain-containing protein n=1 Tax=Mya arenaria TaxID=6604 RepID=UPI0022E17291|nr:IQ and ubiquitin-like domain-containing protein [Mya arenaria]